MKGILAIFHHNLSLRAYRIPLHVLLHGTPPPHQMLPNRSFSSTTTSRPDTLHDAGYAFPFTDNGPPNALGTQCSRPNKLSHSAPLVRADFGMCQKGLEGLIALELRCAVSWTHMYRICGITQTCRLDIDHQGRKAAD